MIPGVKVTRQVSTPNLRCSQRNSCLSHKQSKAGSTVLSSGSRGPWGRGPPLAPKFSSKSYSFQAILRENPYFEQILGSVPPLGSKLCAPPDQNPGSAPGASLVIQNVYLQVTSLNYAGNLIVQLLTSGDSLVVLAMGKLFCTVLEMSNVSKQPLSKQVGTRVRRYSFCCAAYEDNRGTNCSSAQTKRTHSLLSQPGLLINGAFDVSLE